jgi:hypothetical protein
MGWQDDAPCSAVSSVWTATRAKPGVMMGWTEGDGDALFRQPPGEQAGEDVSSGFDGSHEAMRRLRFPFEADPADAAERGQDMPLDDDEYRR